MSLLIVNRALIKPTIPFKDDALFWLNGSISGNQFLDVSGNNRNFDITNKDFESDWTNGFPYKSAATISAPIGDATLIAADINNYLYDSGGNPNQIPVISLFQDIDYENKLFTRHLTQVLDGNNVEVFEPRVIDIVLYNNVKTASDLVLCNSYYNVPAEQTSNVKWVDPINGNNTNPGTKLLAWKTLEYADANATSGDTVYVRTGETIEITNWNIGNSVNWIATGLSIVKSSGTSNLVVADIPNGYSIQGFTFDGQNLNTTVFLENSSTARTANINRCKMINAANASNRYIVNMFNGSYTYNYCIMIGRIANGRINSTVGTSSINFNSCYIHSGIRFTNNISLNNCKLKEPTTTTISLMVMAVAVDVSILGGTIDSSARQIIDVSFAPSGTKNLNVSYIKRFTTSGKGGLILQSATTGFNDININHSNIYITNSTASNFIQLTGSTSDVNFLNNIVSNTGDAGSIFGVSASASGFLTFSNNIIINTSTSAFNNGIGVFSGSNYSYDFQNNYIRSNGTPNGISLSKTTNVSGTVIINNNTIEITGNASYGIRVGDEGTGLGDNTYTSIQITNNKIYCQRYFTPEAETTTHALFVGYQGVNTLISFNLVFGAGLGIAMKGSETDFSGTLCKYNIVTQSYLYGIDCKAIVGGKIYNNTLIENNTEFEFEVNGLFESADQEFRNNIAYNTNGRIYRFGSAGSLSGQTFNHNLLYYTDLFCFNGASDIDLSTWQGLGYDLNSLFTDPLLQNYIPQTGSDAIGNGETLTANENEGLDVSTNWGELAQLPIIILNEQNVNWDIGAYVLN